MFESWKRAKFETFAHYEILNRYGFDDERIGGWKRAQITDEIFSQMKKENMVTPDRYLELFIAKLTTLEHI